MAFKKNVTDTRNSQVIKLVRGLTDIGYKVEVEDPLVDDNELNSYQLNIRKKDKRNYDIVILAVDHDVFINQGYDSIKNLISDSGILVDLNSAFYDHDHKNESILYWSP